MLPMRADPDSHVPNFTSSRIDPIHAGDECIFARPIGSRTEHRRERTNVTGAYEQIPAGQYRCKGSHVIQSRLFINAKLGEGAFEALVAWAGPPWTSPLLPSTWYDVG